MKYVGSKRKIANEIVGIISSYRKPGQYWVEPFVGGANVIEKVKDGPKIGADANKYLIALLKKMQHPSFKAPILNEMQYKAIKNNPNKYEDWLVGYAGSQLGFNGAWFGSYATSRRRQNYVLESKNCVERQSKKIKDLCSL